VIRLESVAYRPPRAPGGAEPPLLLGPIEFAAAPGTSHLLLGANGSGKTTLIRILSGLAAPTQGRYVLYGEAIRVGPEGRSLWPAVGVLFEEPDPQFLADTVEAEVAFGLESLGIPREDVRLRTAETLDRHGLAELASRAPQSLSAGEKARTLLAAALAVSPPCLLLDQALSHLDAGTRRELEERLARETIEEGRILVRTHQEPDPPLPGEILHVLGPDGLRPVSQLTPRGVLELQGVPFPLALRVSSLLALERRWPGPLAADAGQVERALGVERAPRRPVAGEPGAPARKRTVLALHSVSFRPAGAKAPIVAEVSFEIQEGEIVAIVGRSGSGKTTLLKIACGLAEATDGTVRREHPAVPRVRPLALALEYPERQLFGRTVLEDVAALLWVDGIPAEERARSACRALREVGLDPDRFGGRFPLSLSEGEKRRTALAGAMVEPPLLLLLDEPTAGLDPDGRKSLIHALRSLRERGRTVLFASHDLDLVGAVADRALVLARDEAGAGRVLGEGTSGEVLRDPTLLTRAGIPEPEFVRLERALRGAGLLAPSQVRDSESLLDALARGAVPASGG